MAFKVGQKTYANGDKVIKIKVDDEASPNNGQSYTLDSADGVKFMANGSEVVIFGTDGAPIAVLPAGAEPDFEFSGVALEESMDLAGFLGEGAITITVDIMITWWRPGKPARVIELQGALITKGLGGETDSKGSPKDTLGGKCRDIKLDGKSLIKRKAA